MTGSVAVLDFITYLVTKIICIESNSSDPTRDTDLIETLRKRRRINGPIMNFFEDGRFFYSRSKFTKSTSFWLLRFFVIICNSFLEPCLLLFGRSRMIVGHHRLTDELFPAAAIFCSPYAL